MGFPLSSTGFPFSSTCGPTRLRRKLLLILLAHRKKPFQGGQRVGACAGAIAGCVWRWFLTGGRIGGSRRRVRRRLTGGCVGTARPACAAARPRECRIARIARRVVAGIARGKPVPVRVIRVNVAVLRDRSVRVL